MHRKKSQLKDVLLSMPIHLPYETYGRGFGGMLEARCMGAGSLSHLGVQLGRDRRTVDAPESHAIEAHPEWTCKTDTYYV